MSNKKQSSPAGPQLSLEELSRLTAEELANRRLSDGEKVLLRQINEQRAAERKERSLRIRDEQALLLAELRSAGADISNVSDLINTADKYEEAMPILLRHLRLPYSDITRETIARSLARPGKFVKEAWPELLEQYRKAPTGCGIKAPGDTTPRQLRAKDGLACALSVAVTNETLPALIQLVKDKAHGESRLLLLSALRARRKKSPSVQKVLAELANDPQLEKEIASW